MNRWTVFGLSIAGSVALSAGLWALGVPGFFFFLAFPFLLWPKGGTRHCPVCGHATMHPAVRYCPADGTRMA